ncbi:hypothetical protein LINGRAHAP2_LOCUS2743 [Linum grandiflorum]
MSAKEMAADLCSFIIMIVILLSLSSSTNGDNEIRTPEAMDKTIKDYTFKSFSMMKRRIKAGEFYNVDLPVNFSGIKASAGMFRCGSLRRYGAELGELGLGVGLTLKPCLVRVMVIVQKLGLSWSSIYYANYNLSGYQLASPILALTAYDYNATTSIDNNSSYYYPFEVGIWSSESNSSKPITIKFSTATSYSNSHHNVYLCAIFAKDGTVRLNPPISISPPRVCVSTVDGHYGLVVKLSSAKRGKKMLRLALGGLIVVICVSLLLLIVGLSVKKM